MSRTLLEQREEELKVLIENVLVRADTLRKCVEGGYRDTNERLRDLASAAFDARLIAAKVDDLRVIERRSSEPKIRVIRLEQIRSPLEILSNSPLLDDSEDGR